MQHAMDDIKAIEAAFMSQLSEKVDIKSIRNKSRKLGNKISNLKRKLEEPNSCPPKLVINRKTNWDVCNTIQGNSSGSNKSDTNKVYTCKTSSYYTVRNGEIIKLNNTNRLPIEISKEKLSIDCIKNIHNFSKYKIGTPSKIIYIQNLAKSITENDLKTIFKSYEASILSYKVLHGRLKGKAFIAFIDDMSCMLAFDQLNGTFVQNRPMIFEYGKKMG